MKNFSAIVCLFAVSCTSLAPLEFKDDGGFIRVDRGNDVYASQRENEFSSYPKIAEYCKSRGFSAYTFTERKMDGNYLHQYFVCSQK